MKRPVALAVLFGLPTVAVACALAFPLDGFGPGGPGAAEDADVDVDAAPMRPDAACPLARWPERPTADDPGGDDVSVTLAVSSVDMGFGDAGVVPGFDLDGLCTCPDPAPCRSDGPRCDHDGGVDNGGNDLAQKFANFGSVLDQARTNDNIAKGERTFLLVVRGYNGTPNDTNVQLAVLLSTGTPLADGGSRLRPSLRGEDVWTVERSTVLGAGEPLLPRYVDANAYVADGVLVARVSFPFTLEANDEQITVQVDEGIIAGRLTRDSIWRLDAGRLAGRWSTQSFLGSLATLRDPFTDKNLCEGGVTYEALKAQVCASADVMRAAASDGTDQSCDALSFGAGFTAVEAKAGPVVAADAAPPCPPGFTDDCAR